MQCGSDPQVEQSQNMVSWCRRCNPRMSQVHPMATCFILRFGIAQEFDELAWVNGKSVEPGSNLRWFLFKQVDKFD